MNVQSRNYCWPNKCSKPSIRYTKGYEQWRHNISQRKKQHNTISMKAQQSSPRGQTTSRNLNFAPFALIFLIFFMILYDLNRKHTNFQLNWIEGVVYRNSTIFSIKFKAPSCLWVRCLRSQICASSHGQTQLVAGFGWMWNLILPNFKKSTSIRVRMEKLWPFYRSTSGLRFWKAEYDTESKSGKAKICCLWWQRLIQWMKRLKQGFTMNLGLVKREFTQGG
jgi:hypothetical protein